MTMNSLIAYGLSFMNEFEDMALQRKEELIDRFHKTKLMPRKDKKKERKNLDQLWSINEYAIQNFTMTGILNDKKAWVAKKQKELNPS